jgi:hypothetical protein
MFMALSIVGLIAFSFSQDFLTGHFKKNEISFLEWLVGKDGTHLGMYVWGLTVSYCNPNRRGGALLRPVCAHRICG